jgi:hypothetical protein
MGVTLYTTESIIKRFIYINGNKYDYSKVEYVDHNTPVCIICPIHGRFFIKPKYHLRGKGCIKCNINHTLTTEEFKTKARLKHGNKYNYSRSKYIRGEDKIAIICKEHGLFYQKASKHLEGRGCPYCAYNRNIDRTKVHLYVIYDNKENLSKIGITKNINERLKKIELEIGYKLILKYTKENFGHNETMLHRILKEHRTKHPKIHEGYTEWFKLTPNEIIEHINELIIIPS